MTSLEKSESEKKLAEALVDSTLDQAKQDVALSTSLSISAAITLVSAEFVEIFQSRLKDMNFTVTNAARYPAEDGLESYTLASEKGEVVIEIDIAKTGILPPFIYLGGTPDAPNVSFLSGSINPKDRINLDEEDPQIEALKEALLDWILLGVEATGIENLQNRRTFRLYQ